VRKEPWDSGNTKAGILTGNDFGTPESVQEQSRSARTASNRYEATKILKEIIKHGPYTSKSGLTARIPGKSIGKMVSSEAVNASFCPEAHYLAVVFNRGNRHQFRVKNRDAGILTIHSLKAIY